MLRADFKALVVNNDHTKMIKFLENYGDATADVINKFRANPDLIIIWKKIDDNPLHVSVHNSHIKKVDFLEDVHHTFTVKKLYPTVHEYHPGLQETIANHVKGSTVELTHNGNKYIVGYTGIHADYAVTELNPITLIEATLPGGKKYYPGPLPTINATVQTAIRNSVDDISGIGAKRCEVWMWGYVKKTVNNIESLYLDTNGNPVRTWVKKSNSNKTTIFTGMNEDKALIEITYARHNLTVDDWIPNKNASRPSNVYQGISSEGVKMHICIGPEVIAKPSVVPSRKLSYGTVIPKID